MLLKPANVPGAACTPLTSVQLLLLFQSEPLLPFQTPLPEKTLPKMVVLADPSANAPGNTWLSPIWEKVSELL